SFLHNVADAEDAVQETFMRVTRRLAGLTGDPAAYLSVAARNVCRDELRRRLRDGPELSELLADGSDTESAVMNRDTLRDIWDQLSARERVFLTYQIAGYGCADIARQMGLSVNAASVGMHRARARARVLAT